MSETLQPSASKIVSVLPARWNPPIPPASDRSEWRAAAERLTTAEAAMIHRKSEDALARPIEPILASDRLAYESNGLRDRYDVKWRVRRGSLAWLTVAECLDRSGCLVEKIQDLALSTCEESSWEMPAHIYDLTDPRGPWIDLAAAMTALQLAELAYLLGDALHPLIRREIAAAVRTKVFAPYMNREDHWWLRNTGATQVNNWAAVCSGSALASAIYLIEDPGELAMIFARALPSLADYLDGFDESGALSEGIGYWNYGLGYFTIAADLVERRTGGAINLWQDQRLVKTATLPARSALSPGRYPTFSDCGRNVALWRPLLRILASRADAAVLNRIASPLAMDSGLSPESASVLLVRDLFWQSQPSDQEMMLSDYDWLPGVDWLIARAEADNPCGLVLAVKAGHNGEMHNQNDVGSFLVEVNGEQLIQDLGAGQYTAQYFSDRRYELFTTSSRGHSTPEVCGRTQRSGQECRATEVSMQASDHATSLSMNLTCAYPDADALRSLTRTVRLNRASPTAHVEVSDLAEFEPEGELMSVLITQHDVAISGGRCIIEGDRSAICCEFDPSVVSADVETITGVALAEGPASVRRIRFRAKRGQICAVVLRITAVALKSLDQDADQATLS